MDAYYVKHPPVDYTKIRKKKKCGPLCRAKKHWRGIAQVAIVAAGAVVAGGRLAATAGLCAGVSGVILSGAIGAATNMAAYRFHGGKRTAVGCLGEGLQGFALTGGGKFLGLLGTRGGRPQTPRYFKDSYRTIGRRR